MLFTGKLFEAEVKNDTYIKGDGQANEDKEQHMLVFENYEERKKGILRMIVNSYEFMKFLKGRTNDLPFTQWKWNISHADHFLDGNPLFSPYTED